jgi:hypothetical protein
VPLGARRTVAIHLTQREQLACCTHADLVPLGETSKPGVDRSIAGRLPDADISLSLPFQRTDAQSGVRVPPPEPRPRAISARIRSSVTFPST